MKNLPKITMIIAVIIGSVAFLTGCGGGEISGGLTPMPSVDEPSDTQLAESVQKFMKNGGGPVSSVYQHRRVDLNGDGKRDALVIFKNPYGYWCGLYGCTMLIMKASDDNFKLVNAVTPVREPLHVSEGKTNGWKDIIIHISGRWTETKDVALQFDGEKYPNNPDGLPAYMKVASLQGTRLFYD